GDVLEFSGGEMPRAGKLAVGRFFVDGRGVGDVESLVLKDRYHLSQVGMVMVVLALSSATGELPYGPETRTGGVPTENGSEASGEEARVSVLETWEQSGVEARKDPAESQA